MPTQGIMKCSVSYWFYQVAILTRLFWLTILPCLTDFSHFSLHCKLPFLILGIEVLNNMDCKVREHCRLPHTCPQLFYLPLRIHFCQNLLPGEVNLLCVLQQGKKFLMNKKEEFLFTLFHDFPPQRRAWEPSLPSFPCWNPERLPTLCYILKW